MSQRSLRERFGCRVFRDLVEGGRVGDNKVCETGGPEFYICVEYSRESECMSERESWVFYLLCLLDIMVKW